MSDENKGQMSRRNFVKGASMGLLAGAIGSMGVYSYAPWRKAHFAETKRKQTDIGACKRIKITNISETSWFDNATLMHDIKEAGGLLVNQYDYNWPPFGDGKGLGKGSYDKGIKTIRHLLPQKLGEAWAIQRDLAVNPDNSGGYSCLIEIEETSGRKRRILLDTGWSYAWTDESFKREGIDKMLANKEIEALFISHEHFDHFWGLPVTCKYHPTIDLFVPETFYEEGMRYIKDSGHKGRVHKVKKGLHVNPLGIPGFATFVFDVPIICRVYGEQSMFFNVKDKGMVSVTGCCHQSIIQFAETAYREIKYDNDNLHGIYGGLHISPFENWDPKYDDLVIALGRYGFDKIGCNHCTGVITAKKFIDAGYPVVQGTARYRSRDTAYLGNGDVITFGA